MVSSRHNLVRYLSSTHEITLVPNIPLKPVLPALTWLGMTTGGFQSIMVAVQRHLLALGVGGIRPSSKEGSRPSTRPIMGTGQTPHMSTATHRTGGSFLKFFPRKRKKNSSHISPNFDYLFYYSSENVKNSNRGPVQHFEILWLEFITYQIV